MRYSPSTAGRCGRSGSPHSSADAGETAPSLRSTWTRRRIRDVTDLQARPPAPDVPWYHRPFWVLVLLFFILGPLGLPYLWKSPRFSQGIKVVLTIAVVAYTGLLVGQTVALMHAMEDQ